MKDNFVEYPREIIIECKRAHEAELKASNLSEANYRLRSKVLRYYDLLLVYNDTKNMAKVQDLADEAGTNTWQYVNVALTRVKRFLEEREKK